MRAYETERGTAIFRHHDHLDRLFKSAELYYMPIPYTLEELRSATHELIAAQRAARVLHPPDRLPRLRPMGLYPLDAPVDVSIASGRGAPTSARRASATASARRSRAGGGSPHDSLIPHAKASGQYLNSVLAKIEATKAGYEEAILLDDHGFVCEGSGENIYVVRDGVISRRRRPRGSSTASTASRSSRSPRDLGYEVVERDIARAELYLADEVFMTGTAAELVPVREIDDHAIGDRQAGRRSRASSSASSTTRCTAATARYREWLDVVEVAAAPAADGDRLRRRPRRSRPLRSA